MFVNTFHVPNVVLKGLFIYPALPPTCEMGLVTLHILKMRKLKLRRMRNLSRVTHLVRGKACFELLSL